MDIMPEKCFQVSDRRLICPLDFGIGENQALRLKELS
jgi:hypothetical protein